MSQALALFLPAAMMVLMLALGLRLHARDIGAVLAAPRALLTGLAVQVIVLPLIAVLLILMLGLSTPLAAGLLLVAAAPGGVSSNYMAHLARGSVALSVTMTAITSLLAPLTLPLVLGLTGVARLASGDLVRVSLGMAAIGVLPLAIGMVMAARTPRLAQCVHNRLAPAAKALFALMVLATFWQNRAAMAEAAGQAGAAVGLLAMGAPLSALLAARLARLTPTEARTIAIEASLQNVAITLFVAGTLLRQPTLAVPGLIHAVAMNLVALVLILRSRQGESPALTAEALPPVTTAVTRAPRQ